MISPCLFFCFRSQVMRKLDHIPDSFFCRLCGKAATPEVWGGCECSHCGSVSAISLPTQAELKEFYYGFNEKYDGGHSGGLNLIRYANRYLDLLKDHIATGKLIDIGSSASPFPNIATNAGYQVTVMDYVKPMVLNSEIIFLEGNLNETIFFENYQDKYDVVSAWAVLEHVSDPDLACSILSGLCKENGIIILSTPEIGTFLTNNSIGRSGWFYPPMHLHLLSPIVVRNIFAKNDCDLLEWGRLELNSWRYIARYGIGLIEAIVGVCMKLFFRNQWEIFRKKKIQVFKGITYFVLRKHS